MIIPGTVAFAAVAWREAEKAEIQAQIEYNKADRFLQDLDELRKRAISRVQDQQSLVDSLSNLQKSRSEAVVQAAEHWAEAKAKND